MKIVVIGGENTDRSYERYAHIVDGLKKRGLIKIEYDGTTSLSELLSAQSLFSEEVFVVCDGFEKILERDLNYLNEGSGDGRFLLYVKKEIGATIKKKLPKEAVFESFDLPKEIWRLVDSLFLLSDREYTKLMQLVLRTEPAELVLAVIAKRLVDIYEIKNGGRLSSAWVEKKVSKQAGKVTVEKLEEAVSMLSKFDVESKEGKGDLSILLTVWVQHVLA